MKIVDDPGEGDDQNEGVRCGAQKAIVLGEGQEIMWKVRGAG